MSSRGLRDTDLTGEHELLERIWDARPEGSPSTPVGRDPDVLKAFLADYYRHVAAEELAERDPADLYGGALAHLVLAAARQPGELRLRAYHPDQDTDGWTSPHTVVEIVTDDMPFLVDSVTSEMSRRDIGLNLVVHPQLVVRRDASGQLTEIVGDVGSSQAPDGTLVESWMRLEVDRQQPEALDELTGALERVLGDVRAAVDDWPAMRDQALAIAGALGSEAMPVPGGDKGGAAETAELFRWLADDHFIFLGYRQYELVPAADAGADSDVLRAVEGTGLGILNKQPATSRSFAQLTPEARAKAKQPALLVITKANSRSTVHRPSYLDYIGVKTFDKDGNVVGERRFLGLFCSAAYLESVRDVPVVRRKVTEVLRRSGFGPGSHSGKDLLHILETYPRDELFQTSADDLLATAVGVLRLQERRRLRLFLRRDDYGRFYSCLVFLPRDRYNTTVRLRMQEILLAELHGTGVEYSTRVGESVLARLHFIVRTDPAAPPTAGGAVDADALQRRMVEATRTWDEDFADELVRQFGDAHAKRLLDLYGDAFPEAYKEDFPATEAVADLRRLDMLEERGDVSMSLYQPVDGGPTERRFKIYRIGERVTLSDVLPVLQAMGVKVADERPYEVERGDGSTAWIYDFGLQQVNQADVAGTDVEGARERFQNAFAAVWRNEAEVDGFNSLVLRAGLTWRQAVVLRAYAKYLRQVGIPFSQEYVEQAVVANTDITGQLVELFEARFHPGIDADERTARCAHLVEQIGKALDAVASLDQDRILRTFLRLILATVRTNYFQRGGTRPKPYVSFKLDPEEVSELPRPRPKHEIWVYGPRVEGVHLRFGAVARGGLRWSDRREDFRTEILGLVKAQMVKNSVIVPVGAKGGFVVKRPPAPTGDPAADRDALFAEGIECYKMFISAMLDVTDNRIDGDIVPPVDVVRHDGDDPYLVVAADKGTATFSDIANEVARSYGFWLGDAFASGGSAGYDHKRMGITAKGAWESVKRHFREMGVDTQTQDFTAVGVGDMSGDVFGNGMLCSEHIRLVAAFDHRHVFVDPDPDPAVSYAERRRLFELPRSSWADYDTSLISAGGGVWPRTAKSIPVSEPMRAALGLAADVTRMTPVELIRAILLAPVDLLWNGGIGTYVKASDESHADVGDKSNDAVRVDAVDLRCKVVGEGGNLGFTQRGRIEYARATDGRPAGRINTDAIDNSAGVDCSDHEVNIKILLDRLLHDGVLSGMPERDALLATMTDEVGALCLRDNYEQNLVLGVSRFQSAAMTSVHLRQLADLEKRGKLDRRLEFLPSNKELARRAETGDPLTSPELSVLLAYVKIVLERELTASSLPDDPWFAETLVDYFPTPLRRYHEQIGRHALRREIISTCVVNDMVNNSGATYVFRAQEETGAGAVDAARAYFVVREVFGLRDFWAAVEALDNRVSTDTQNLLLLECRRLMDRSSRWLLQNRRLPLDIGAEIARFRPTVVELAPRVPDLLVDGYAERMRGHERRFVEAGVPANTALRAAELLDLFSTLDITEVALRRELPVTEVAEVYYQLSWRYRVDDLLEQITALPRDDRWHALARSALRYDTYTTLAELTGEVLDSTPRGEAAADRVTAWERANAAAFERVQNSLGELVRQHDSDLATLSVVLRQFRTLVRASASR